MVDKKINRVLKKLRVTSTVNRLTGGGRPESVSLKKMVTWLTMVLSQKDTLQTHRTVSEISRETGIRLRCCEITIMSSIAAFYWNTILLLFQHQKTTR